MQKNDFILAGQSYVGIYLPNIAHRILKQNDIDYEAGKKKEMIPLKSVLIGNGLVDLVL